MDAEAEARRFRDVFHQLHLRAVKADAIDVEAFARGLDIGGDAVDQRILAALGAVDPLEALCRVCAGKRAQVMRDRIVIAVVPIRDPGEGAAGLQVDGVSAAAELGRHQQHPVAEIAAANVGFGIDEFTIDRMTLRLGVAAAAVLEPLRRNALARDHWIAERNRLADHRRSGSPGQEAAPVEPGRRPWRRLGDLHFLLLLAGDLFLQVFRKIP